MTSIKCESCGQNYEPSNVDVLGHREDMWFLRVFCEKCQTQCLVAAVVKQSRGPEGASGLAGTEAEDYVYEKIEVDDVLDMRNFLVDFDGDFLKLFGQEKRR
jgi:hypothetical protein